MTKGKLAKLLEPIPDNAIVYIEADHGQIPETTGGNIVATRDHELEYFGEDIEWSFVDDLDKSLITAILIR